jgi:hypothetical protein
MALCSNPPVRKTMKACLGLLGLLSTLLVLSVSPASASDACTTGTNAPGDAAYYCGVWVPTGGVPVYSSTAASSTIIDHLHTGGTANWFYCSQSGGTASASGYSSTSWARTVGDTVISGAAHANNSGQVNNYMSQLRPGDILFYGSHASQHVAVYMGSGKQMNAYQSGVPDGVTGVTTGDVFWARYECGEGRTGDRRPSPALPAIDTDP